jgi:Flp pilus assembly protein TadG
MARGRVSARRSRGAALVETGIIISLLILATFSVFDLAGLFFTYLSFQNGVTQACRFAVTNQGGANHDQLIRQALRDNTPGFTIADADVTFLNITTGGTDSGAPGQIVRVTVVHNWQLYSPLVRPVFNNGLVTVRASAAMRNEPLG